MGETINRVSANFNKYKFLLKELVVKDIKLKYRRSYLGILWTLLEPLFTMIVLSTVFSQLYGRDDNTFPVYVLSGRLLYSFFSGSTKGAMKSIRTNAAMIKKVYVPKYMYPLAAIISNFVIFLISLIVLVVVALVLRMKLTLFLFGAVIPIFLLLIMSTGVGLMLSTMAVFFRDLEHLWGVVLMIIMYCSAIFYRTETILQGDGGRKAWIFKLNPLYAAIRNFRNAIYYGNDEAVTGFHLPSLAYLAGFSAIVLIIGIVMFYKRQDEFILNI